MTIRGRSVSLRHLCVDLGGCLRTGTEGDSPFFDVRAGDIDLDTADSCSAVQDLRHAPIFINGFAEDVGDHRNVIPSEKRQFLCDEGPDADVLESDGVEHPGRGLHDPRRRISGPSFKREPLDHDRPQSVQIDKRGVLLPVTERARCRHDGILQFKAADCHRQAGGIERGLFILFIHFPCPLRACGRGKDYLPQIEHRAVLADSPIFPFAPLRRGPLPHIPGRRRDRMPSALRGKPGSGWELLEQMSHRPDHRRRSACIDHRLFGVIPSDIVLQQLDPLSNSADTGP